MKKISIVLLYVAMLFAFTACNNSTPTGSSVLAYDEDDLIKYVNNSGVTSVTIVGKIELSQPITITTEGFQLIGTDESSITVSSENEVTGAQGMINVNADNVVIDKIDFIVPSDSGLINIIYTNNEDLKVQGSSFSYSGTISTYEEIANSKINMAIDIDAGGSAVISGTSFTNAVTPVYVSSQNVRIENCKFNSGIEFETIGSNAVVNCEPVGEGDVLGTAKVTIWYTGAPNTTTTEADAKAFLDRVSGDEIITRLYNGTDTTVYPAE